MTVYESISLMISFGTLITTIIVSVLTIVLSYTLNRKK